MTDRKPVVIPNGTCLGPYEILARIGSGGMGEVYKARDRRLGRMVAIKRVRPDRLDERSCGRFHSEAKAIAGLAHPHICTLYDVIDHEGDALLVMEYLEGETLSERFSRASMPIEPLLRCAKEIADALDRAHRHGIIHRDLKPGNVILTRQGAKLVDFGLAKSAAAPASVDQTELRDLTVEGTIVGTLAYMAPEQLQGHEIDARTDLFALGVILYEGLTGHRPFAGDSCAALLAAMQNETPSASDLRPDAPAPLVRLVDKCLAKSPDERWKSAHDVMLQLGEIEESYTGRERPLALPRHRISRSTMIASSLAVAILLGGGLMVSRRDAGPIKSLAILPLANGSGNAGADYLGDGISDSIIAKLSQLPQLSVVPRSLSWRFKGRQTNPREISRNLKARAILTGSVVERGDTIAITVELFDAERNKRLWGKQYVRKFADIFEVQEDIAGDVSNNLRLQLSAPEEAKLRRRYTDDSEAYRFYLQARYEYLKWDEAGMKKAIILYERAIAADPSYAPAYAGLGAVTVCRHSMVGFLPRKVRSWGSMSVERWPSTTRSPKRIPCSP